MNHILVTHPHPACILTTHPARAYSDPESTDVAKTWEQHRPTKYTPDDYDLVTRDDWLSATGGFK